MIEQYHINTSMGRVNDSSELPFLSSAEIEEFNKIGYTGKDSGGMPRTFQEYLNRLNLGEFVVRKTRSDNGDFSEEYSISRHTPSKNTPLREFLFNRSLARSDAYNIPEWIISAVEEFIENSQTVSESQGKDKKPAPPASRIIKEGKEPQKPTK